MWCAAMHAQAACLENGRRGGKSCRCMVTSVNFDDHDGTEDELGVAGEGGGGKAWTEVILTHSNCCGSE